MASQAEPMTIDELIAALTAIRSTHGNVGCRLVDRDPIRSVVFVDEQKFTLPESELVLAAHVVISHRDGVQDTFTRGL
jgi:hypothetical protein